jgi:hypothetical protein
MARKAAKIQIRSVLIAEDVRFEATGQQTIIGAYGNSISTTNPSLKLPRVTFRVEFISPDTFEAECNFSVVTPSGKTAFAMPQPLKVSVRGGISAVCALSWGPVEFTEQGVHEILFGVDGKARKVSSFEVKLNAEPKREVVSSK